VQANSRIKSKTAVPHSKCIHSKISCHSLIPQTRYHPTATNAYVNLTYVHVVLPQVALDYC